MTFVPRTYDEIVRDMLTAMTRGVVAEQIEVPPDTLLMPKLKNAPVRRVSHVEERIDTGDEVKKRVFTVADFELVSTTGNAAENDRIRFREKGRKPVPGATLLVNYFPAQTLPVPLTDVTVGSVVRTIVETIGFELALTYQQLDLVYRSAFVETAEGAALDRVVALVGVRRLKGGHPVTKVRFTRAPSAAGNVTIPAGTPITDAKGNRYLTTADATMEVGEATRELLAAGESSSTEEVPAGELKLLEVAISGISEVSNPAAAHRLTVDETDAALRLRARGGLRGTMRGTVDAIRFGLLAIAGVKELKIDERPGEIDVTVAYLDPSEEVKAQVKTRIDELRPAGIVVVRKEAATEKLDLSVQLTLAEANVSGAELEALKAGVEAKIKAVVDAVPPGGKLRAAQLLSAALSDPRVVNAEIPEMKQDRVLPAETVLALSGPVKFLAPLFDKTPEGQAVTGTVSATIPLHLVGPTTVTEARQKVESGIAAHLTTRKAGAPLTVDGLIGAIRDEGRYAIARSEVLVTVESQGNFRQLSDTAGSYEPAANEKLVPGTIAIDVREGTVETAGEA